MSFHSYQFPGATLQLFAAAEDALAQIPPAFGLEATVAVNPYLGQAGESRLQAASRLARVAGARITAPREVIAAWLEAGRVTEQDIAAAAFEAGLDPDQVQKALHAPSPAFCPDPTLADLAARKTGQDWPALIADRVGLWAGGHFDKGQALWPAPGGSAFKAWRAFALRDLTPGLHGLRGFCAFVASLPTDPRAAFAELTGRLDLSAEAAPLYLHRLAMSLGGWAQYVRGLGWADGLKGERNALGFEMLVIRLAWEVALLDCFADQLAMPWTQALKAHAAPLEPSLDLRIDLALQEAADQAEERALAEKLATSGGRAGAPPPDIQAIFCIDVRSEPFRRALESADPGVQTRGFAGFFGLPIAHLGLASDQREARAPVLLEAALNSQVAVGGKADQAERITRRATRAWGRFKLAAVSSFAFVEAAGPLYLGKLFGSAMAQDDAPSPEPVPALDLPSDERIALAGRVLRAMSLTSDFAPVVLIAGHGAHVTNAPHASALQCGACGGHAGDVNARLLAELLNDPVVRKGLSRNGIAIPPETRFLAGLHDTVSDALHLFDEGLGAVPQAHLVRLQAALAKAGEIARTARAQALPRAAFEADLPRRGKDWSELRPEWGLAGCRAFIVAPRARSLGCDLGGRAFLHDYHWRQDDGFATLELILTAPAVVTSWIALQYHGSATAPEVFGAGNKLLHNVVGGIGVFEGNGGDLRVGLPMQSLHDGEQLRHDPLRLSVVVAAPKEAISGVLERHPQLKTLFDNGWLSLQAMDDAGRICARYEQGAWIARDQPPAIRAA
ncbi:hypothetical protein AXZ77_0672 [Thioclava sp. ES.031]|uniref:YbcC family protein n=1 Tax=Thioclava sp. ES.031 TaxID=1798203 RepID=UPI000BF4589E|nr:DUF2309 domain-containing protein [Thioclava sp. ES.031]PFG62105.1 hypothetical protein AXZ77_0672 [Thioclava sp. ES.031]